MTSHSWMTASAAAAESSPVVRRAAIDEGPEVAPPAVHQVIHSVGSPLDDETRTFMEARFGADFSGVRIHTDAAAAASAEAVRARAYTVGQDIAFAPGAYAPGSDAGRRTLAHELTHTIQQGGGAGTVSPQLAVGAVDDPTEDEAERVSRMVMDVPPEPAPDDDEEPAR